MNKKNIYLKYWIIGGIVFAMAVKSVWSINVEPSDAVIGTDQEDNSGLMNADISMPADTQPEDSTIITLRRAEFNDPSINASGLAIVSKSDDIFTHLLRIKIEEPSPDQFYEAWLVKPGDSFSIGRLDQFEDVFGLQHISEIDRSDYQEIVITQQQEKDGVGAKMGREVLRAKFENIEQ